MTLMCGKGLALDASVLINLLPTNRMAEILTALCVPLVVTAQTYREFYIDPRDRTRNTELLAPFVSSGVFQRVVLAEDALGLCLDLAGASPPDDLNDGEAATLAYSRCHSLDAVVDETKTRNVCKRLFPDVVLYSTIELFRSRQVVDVLGPEGLTGAIFAALHLGRMRVAAEHDAWVRELLGPERVSLCRSLQRRR